MGVIQTAKKWVVLVHGGAGRYAFDERRQGGAVSSWA